MTIGPNERNHGSIYTVGRGNYVSRRSNEPDRCRATVINIARDSQSAVLHIPRREKLCDLHDTSPANKRRWNDRLRSNTYHDHESDPKRCEVSAVSLDLKVALETQASKDVEPYSGSLVIAKRSKLTSRAGDMSLACLILALKPEVNGALEKGDMSFRGILRLCPFVHADEAGCR